MPTPPDRVPVRPVQGNRVDLDAVLSSLQDAEIAFSVDEGDLLYNDAGTFVDLVNNLAIASDPIEALGGSTIQNVVTLPQATYDALTPDPNTVYIIGGEAPVSHPTVFTLRRDGNGAETVITTGFQPSVIIVNDGPTQGIWTYGMWFCPTGTHFGVNGTDYPQSWYVDFEPYWEPYWSSSVKITDATSYTIGTSTTMNGVGDTDMTHIAFPATKAETLISNGSNIDCYSYSEQGTGFAFSMWTGNGLANQTIAHDCGVQPAIIWAHAESSSAYAWQFGPLVDQFHTAIEGSTVDYAYTKPYNAYLRDSTTVFGPVTSTNFEMRSTSSWYLNKSGVNAGAMMFYDSPGRVKTGVTTGAGTGVLTLDCGFEPEWVFVSWDAATGGYSNQYFLTRNNGHTTGDFVWQDSTGSAGAVNGGGETSQVSTLFKFVANGFSVEQNGPGNDNSITNSTIMWIAVAPSP